MAFPHAGRLSSTLQFDTDIGVDLSLGRSLILRIGGTFGDRPAFGAGLAFRRNRV